MIDERNIFSDGLDLDSSLLKVSKASYVDALNITRDAVSGNNDKATTNIVGNQLRECPAPPAGENETIGGYGFTLRNTILFFQYNTEGYHSIWQYDRSTHLFSKIFENLTDSDGVDILSFSLTEKINSIDVFPRENGEGDLLFFLDSLGRPTTMNIQRFIAGEYTPVTREIINVIKRPPLAPPSCAYGNDTSVRSNNLRNRLFKFQYLWVFDDFEESTLGPESAVPYPVNILSETFTNEITNNNVIRLVLNSGPKNVKAVKLLMSFVQKTNNWSDFVVVDEINKADGNIADDSTFNFNFYNDSTYPVYNLTRRIQLYDYVPDKALCQAMPNGNVLTYAGVTEGLSRDLTPDVTITINTIAAGEGGATGGLNAAMTWFGQDTNEWKWGVFFTGIPITGTIVKLFIQNKFTSTNTLIASYTTVAGDTPAKVAIGILNYMNTFGTPVDDQRISGGSGVYFEFAKSTYNNLSTSTVTLPATTANNNSIATWPFSTQRRIGIVYYDINGKTNGVLYNEQVVFPAYAENGSQQVLLPYINIKINHTPPLWAHSYNIVATQEGTQMKYWETIDVNTDETDYIYFDITNMELNQTKFPTTAAVLDWKFQDGDRMRLIRKEDDNTVYNDTYDAAIEGIVVNPKINGADKTGTFIKIKKVVPFSAVTYTSKFFIIQLYRAVQQEAAEDELPYYELGQQYAILNPETDGRLHAGLVSNQDESGTPAEINIYEGDVYFRLRSVVTSESGMAAFFVQDRNFVDFYISAVNSISGRPSAIDLNAKPTYFSAMGRFGQAYQPNTDLNRLNWFYYNNTYEVDISYGDIMRLLINDRQMWVFQKYKTGQMPIFSQINKQPDGTTVNVVTDQLINPIQYYAGNWGINTAASSLVLFNYAAYFCDNKNGVVLRLSRDGLTPISVLFKVNSWANRELPLRVDGKFIYGAYDQRLNNYIISLEQSLNADSMIVPNQGIVNYHADFIVSTTLVGACAGETITLYSGVPFAVGIVLYTDNSLATPLTGYTHIVGADNQIYEINSTTGEVGGLVVDGICGVGTAGNYKLGNGVDTVCAISSEVLYTDGAFGIGSIMYYDSSLLTPVTGFDFIVFLGLIYTMDSATGEVLTDTGTYCNSGIAGVYRLGNDAGTICSQPTTTLYTITAFETGIILYINSNTTTVQTGYDYVVDEATGYIYALNDATGEVGALTGDYCPIAPLYYYGLSDEYPCPSGPSAPSSDYVASYSPSLELGKWYFSSVTNTSYLIATSEGSSAPVGGPWPILDSWDSGNVAPTCSV